MLKLYIDVFRPSRWYRNLFMLLGSLLYFILDKSFSYTKLIDVSIAFTICCLIASANYGVNEFFDKESDKAHPKKKYRALPSESINAKSVLFLSALIYSISISITLLFFNYIFALSAVLFIISGILYNIPPFRFKDYPYVDFIFEAINNPIRLLLGWYAVSTIDVVVPSSFIISYWAFGIFLMSAKRFGEIRFIGQKAEQILYRKSLAHYTEENLLICVISGLSGFMFMFGIVVLKYNIDLVLLLPFVIFHVGWFFKLLFEEDTIIKDPERVFEKKGFFLFTVSIAAIGLLILKLDYKMFYWLL